MAVAPAVPLPGGRPYAAELDERPGAWQQLLEAAATDDLTLLHSSRDRERNDAVALCDHLPAKQ